MEEYFTQMKESEHLDPESLISAYDELPLWSAPFGLKLLDTIPLEKGFNVLDIGFGTGFPLLEIAERMGYGSKIYGIDPWKEAVRKTRQKAKVIGLPNVELTEGYAEDIPFRDDFFHLIVSNNGLNNVADIHRVLGECFRVCKKNGIMVFTVNLPGTMHEFYTVFRELLKEKQYYTVLPDLEKHITGKRKEVKEWEACLNNAGFEIHRFETDTFFYRFASAEAFFNHFFIRLAFLPSWKQLLQPVAEKEQFFKELAIRLDFLAEMHGELRLTVPYVIFDCKKL